MDMDLGAAVRPVVPVALYRHTMWALYICIFIVIYGRMIEIYLVTSVAPIPMATMMGKEWGGMGQKLSALVDRPGLPGISHHRPVWRSTPCWCRVLPPNPTSLWPSGAAWVIRSCCALRSLRPAASQNPFSMHINQEGGNSFGLMYPYPRILRKSNQGRVQFNQEAAGLLRRRGAHRRTAVLFTPGACGKQRGCYVL